MACVFVLVGELLNRTATVPASTLEEASQADVSMCVDIFFLFFPPSDFLFILVCCSSALCKRTNQ